MLKAAADARLKNNDKECLEEINWLIEEINQISGLRNTTAHTLWTTDYKPRQKTRDYNEIYSAPAIPDLIRGNPLGKKIKDKPASEIYRALSGYCVTLIQFSRSIDVRLRGWDDGEPSPERPERPHVLHNH